LECPHCGGWIAAGAPTPLAHPCFDDHWHHIVVGDQRRPVSATAWRALLLLRQRFRRFVPSDFLAQHSARNPADGGSIGTLKVQIVQLRAKLVGSAFTIVTQYGFGYALFPADEVTIRIDVNGRRHVRAGERPSPMG
jgi:DNA-binding response OmpR family regulator